MEENLTVAPSSSSSIEMNDYGGKLSRDPVMNHFGHHQHHHQQQQQHHSSHHHHYQQQHYHQMGASGITADDKRMLAVDLLGNATDNHAAGPQAHTLLSVSSGGNGSQLFSDLMLEYVNLKLVRRVIAQNPVEFLFICVIITYLIYYFSQISRRPRLIGDSRSKFVNFIRANLNDTLSKRFSPLIYFWGTNPQTALFGYLQGQSSLDEMPRNKFRRQYLYVSDAQYLTSNVDLSQHYSTSGGGGGGKHTSRRRKSHLVPLQVGALLPAPAAAAGSLLDQNIRLALNDMLHQHQQQLHQNHLHGKKGGDCASAAATMGRRSANAAEKQPVDHTINIINNDTNAATATTTGVTTSNGDASLSGSSSDSGVFAGNLSTTCSTSSLSDHETLGDDTSCSCRSINCSSAGGHMLSDLSAPMPALFNQSEKGAGLEAGGGPMVPPANEFGQCALDWHKDSHAHYHKNKLVALISAGMTTGSDKKYVTDTVATLERLGYEVCVFIRRGVGGLKLSSTKFFSPAKWRDFEAAVLSVRQQRPGARLVSVGFSFGSIELCRYLAMSGQRSLVDAALLISCPFDPEAGGRNMRKRVLNRRIDAYLAKNLGKQLYQALFAGSTAATTATATTTAAATTTTTLAAAPTADAPHSLLQCATVSNLNGSMVNLAQLPKIKSLVDFEDNYNRVLQNYPNSEAYAADSRLHEHLASIATPTLCLSSEDDFMAPLKLLPLDQVSANRNLCMVLTKRGGHMAFIDGILWPKRPYFAQRIIGKYMEAFKSRRLPAGDLLLSDLSSSSSSSAESASESDSSSSSTIGGQQHDDRTSDNDGDNNKRQLPHHKKSSSDHHLLQIYDGKLG